MGRHAKKSRNKWKILGAIGGGAALPAVAATPAVAEQLDPAAVTAIAEQGCPELSASELDTAVKIAGAESDLITDINAYGGEDSRGLWQINAGVHGSPWGDLYDPVTNARAMCDLSSGGADWSPWSAYTNGSYLAETGAVGGGDAPAPAPDPQPRPNRQADYVVEAGDTLSDISLRFRGDASEWGQVWRNNRHAIGTGSPHLIYPGTELNLPGGQKSQSQNSQPDTSSNQTSSSTPPVDAPVTQDFGVPGDYAAGYHTGTDYGAVTGTTVVSVAPGTVVAPDSSPAYGTNVQIEHDNGLFTLYAHLSSAAVSPGQRVDAGTVVGAVGSTGNSTGPHLHFECRTAPQYGAVVEPEQCIE